MSAEDAAYVFVSSFDLTDEQVETIEAMVKEGHAGLVMADKIMLLISAGGLFEILGRVDRPVKAYIIRIV